MNTNFKVIGLTRLGIKPQVYRSRSRRSIPLGHLIGYELCNFLKCLFELCGDVSAPKVETWLLCIRVSVSVLVLKRRCQVSVLVWFHRCCKIGSSFSFAYAQLRFLGFSFGSSFIQESYFTVNTNYLNPLLLGIFVLLR